MGELKKKNRILVFIGVIVPAVLCVILIKSNKKEIPVVRYDANMQVYQSEEEFAEAVDLIVIGTVKTDLEDDEIFLNDFDNDGDIDERVTLSKFYVQRVLKGDCESDVITVLQPVCIAENLNGEICKFVLDRYEEMEKWHTYILYMDKVNDRDINVCGEYACYPEGIYQGVIDLSEDLTVSENSGNETEYNADMSHYRIASNLKNGAVKRYAKEIKETSGIDFTDREK